MTREFHGVIKVTIGDIVHLDWGRKNLLVAHG
jgi:hypothetical protein